MSLNWSVLGVVVLQLRQVLVGVEERVSGFAVTRSLRRLNIGIQRCLMRVAANELWLLTLRLQGDLLLNGLELLLLWRLHMARDEVGGLGRRVDGLVLMDLGLRRMIVMTRRGVRQV